MMFNEVGVSLHQGEKGPASDASPLSNCLSRVFSNGLMPPRT